MICILVSDLCILIEHIVMHIIIEIMNDDDDDDNDDDDDDDDVG